MTFNASLKSRSTVAVPLLDAVRFLRVEPEPARFELFGFCGRCCANTKPGITRVVIKTNKFRYIEILFTAVLEDSHRIVTLNTPDTERPEPQYNGCIKGWARLLYLRFEIVDF